MALHFQTNQYQGINAHLHSYLQQRGEWRMFHGEHITHLREALQAQLPPESGYYVLSEKSLQLIRDDFVMPTRRVVVVIPDIGIYKTHTPAGNLEAEAVQPGTTISLVETLTEPENVRSVAVYKGDTIITRIELLSPANKPPGSHYLQYRKNRDETLLAGINLVELDYLHERRSVLDILPDYPAKETNAYPYVILISSPQPTVAAGKTEIYGFRVDDPIPTIRVPLNDGNSVSLSLNTVYNHTFSANTFYGLNVVDYENLPENFEAYDVEDQRRIRTRIETVLKQ